MGHKGILASVAFSIPWPARSPRNPFLSPKGTRTARTIGEERPEGLGTSTLTGDSAKKLATSIDRDYTNHVILLFV